MSGEALILFGEREKKLKKIRYFDFPNHGTAHKLNKNTLREQNKLKHLQNITKT